MAIALVTRAASVGLFANYSGIQREALNMAQESSLCLCPLRLAARGGFRLESRSLGMLMVFLFLSVLDFLMTMQLVNQSGGWVYESNPLANWWLARGGWVGLALFKLGIVTTVTYAWSVIALLKPSAGDRVLAFACSILALVVLYSGSLSGFLHACPDEAGIEQAQFVQSESRSLDQSLRGRTDLRETQSRLAGDLARGRCSVTEAVERLHAHSSHSSGWLALRRWQNAGLSDRQCLALMLAGNAFALSLEPTVVEQLHMQLIDDFQVPENEIAKEIERMRAATLSTSRDEN
jgi:hypothetical protein